MANGYTAWGRGEPNNGSSDGSENCGNMFGKGDRSGKWNDLPCSRPEKYLKYAPVILCKKKVN